MTLSVSVISTIDAYAASPKYTVVISRERPELYAELSADFPDDPVIEVVLDRRIEQRRRTAPPPLPGDRRGRDRRINPAPYHDLATAGYVLVRSTSA
jgi:hypothetical protein